MSVYSKIRVKSPLQLAHLIIAIFIPYFCPSSTQGEITPVIGTTKAYFQSFSGYDIPPKLVGKMTKSEAEGRKAYFVAEIHDTGQVVRLDKVLDGKIVASHKYQYFPNGQLRLMELWKENAAMTISEYDESGKLRTFPTPP